MKNADPSAQAIAFERGKRTAETVPEFQRHWLLLLGCALATSVGATGLFNYAAAVLYPYWLRDLGIDRGVLGQANALYAFAVLIGAPLTGALIDRYGVLVIAAFSFVAQVLLFLAFAAVPQHHAAAWIVILSGMIAAFAMGTSPIGFARLVAARFVRQRGLALGLMTSTQGIVAMTLPLLLTPVIVQASWRSGELLLAAISAIAGIAGCVLIRLAGEGGRPKRSGETASREISDWSALKRPLAWILIVCFFGAPLSATGWLLQYADLAHQRGLALADATRAISLIGLTMLVGRLASGIMLDRLSTGAVALSFFLLAAIGCFIFPLLSPGCLWLAPLAIGAIVGAEQDLLPFIATKYFPARSVGKLYGCFYGAFIVGGGMSVIAHGALMEAGLSLTAAFDVSAAVLTLAGVTICVALSMAERHDGYPVRA